MEALQTPRHRLPMSLRTSIRPRWASLLAVPILLTALPAPAAAQGPFQPGLRWIDGASLQTPWIPTSVSFGASDQLVWVGAGVGSDRLLLYDAPGSGVAVPALQETNLGPGVDLVSVLAGPGASQLFALTQRDAPDVFHRVTEVSCRDLLQGAPSGGGAPSWSHDLGFAANGPGRMDLDAAGSTVVVAAWDDAQGRVRVDRVAGATGALLARVDLAAPSLEGLALSADGERVVLLLGSRLLVLTSSLSVVHDQSLADNPSSVAISSDGTRLVVGCVGAVRVFDELLGAYAETQVQPGALDQVASKVGVSAGGEVYAAAWWRFTNKDRLEYEVYDGVSHSQLISDVQIGQLGGLQNSPSGLELSADGSRVAFSSWGRGDSAPEVVLYDVPSASLVFSADLPGSAMALDLDASGTRLAVVTKSLHANLMSSTGEVRLYDTGERDLALLGPTLLGGTLIAAASAPGASGTFFLLGKPRAVPAPFPGALGVLTLERDQRLKVFARPTDLSGTALLSLPISGATSLLGADLGLQAVSRVAGQLVFSETSLDLLFH